MNVILSTKILWFKNSKAGNWTRVSCVTGRNTNHYTTSDYIIYLDFLYYVCYRLCFFIYTSLTLLLHHTTTLLPPHPLNMRIQQIRRYNKLHIKLNVNSTITVSIIYDVTLNFEPNIRKKKIEHNREQTVRQWIKTLNCRSKWTKGWNFVVNQESVIGILNKKFIKLTKTLTIKCNIKFKNLIITISVEQCSNEM